MRAHSWIGTLAAALLAGGSSLGGEHAACPPPAESFLKRIAPVGGWHPDRGGLLHWWPKHCFPCGGAPDDYCRKPLPPVCRPPYLPYYIWGPPEVCTPSVCDCKTH